MSRPNHHDGATEAGLDAHLVMRTGGFELDVHLRAEPGSVLALLGPNGAGKTTAIDGIAGHRHLDDGRVILGERVLEEPAHGIRIEPGERRIGHVPQGLVLFPHLRAVDNVAFGLRARGTPRRDAERRALEILDRLGAADVAHARPSALSGGQAQRVALARALVGEPDLLLLDEPFGSLDVITRTRVRRELTRHLTDFHGPTVLVTHEPLDALLLADRLAIVENGRITQEGTPAELTTRPRTAYVAALVGTNLLEGVARDRDVEITAADGRTAEGRLRMPEAEGPGRGPVFLAIAPSAIGLHRERPEEEDGTAPFLEVATIDLVAERVRVGLVGAPPLVAEISTRDLVDLRLETGDRVWVSIEASGLARYAR